MFERFASWHRERHEYARGWKARTGGKVVGYFCTYVPEEILHAAGILPVRILGAHEPEDVTAPHILSHYCPFCRDCLAQGLKGRYEYLDGLVIAQSCMHIRQTFHAWRDERPVHFSHYIHMPQHVQSPRATPYLAGELAAFKRALEEWTGTTLGEEDLDRGIETYNANRRLMKRAYESRRAARPPLTGLEAMQIVVSSQLTDKEEHSRALAETLEQLPERELERDPGVRLMMVGSENDDTEFVAMVESLGATIVIDEHCTGSRYFWNEVVPDPDRLKAIAARYVDRVPCPSKDWPEWTRFKHILQLAQEFDVQGVLLLQQKFCDPHEIDIPALDRFLKENGLSTLFLEFDVTVPVGQFQTRVEAFLEMLREDELF